MLVWGSHFTAKINKFISLTLWSITTVMQCKLKYKFPVCYSDITMFSDSLNYMYVTVCLSVCLIQVKVEVGCHCPSDWVPFVILELAWVCACMHNKTWNRRTWVLTQLVFESKKKQHKIVKFTSTKCKLKMPLLSEKQMFTISIVMNCSIQWLSH